MQKPFITRPCRYFIGIAIFIVILITVLFKDPCIVTKCNVPCYYSETGDALPSAEDPSFSPKATSIFFHETSCRSGLTVRQACAVEAAARAHPKQEIYVLFSAPVTDYELKTSCLAELLQFPNVKFLRVHAAEYSKGTAVQSILLNDYSEFRIQHTADILRMLTLNKWGGIYLDTDVIVTRSLENLPPNFVTKESDESIASAILSFANDEIGTNLSNEVIKEISKNYTSQWPVIGATAVEEVLQRLCPKMMRSGDFLAKSINNCKGIMIFDYELFYPQDYIDIDVIFKPAPKTFDLDRPYAYRMWDSLSHNKTIRRGTVYELVAKAFCPTIHSQYSYEFSAVFNTPATEATTPIIRPSLDQLVNLA